MKLTATLVLERDTKNCLVFSETGDKPMMKNSVYIPKDTPGVEGMVAMTVTLDFIGAEAPVPAPEAAKPDANPAKPARVRRSRKAVAA